MKRHPRLDLNPSSADRWTTCTASPRFILENNDKVPKSTDTVYNVEGTLAHAVASAFLLGQKEPKPVPYEEPRAFGHGCLCSWRAGETCEVCSPKVPVKLEKTKTIFQEVTPDMRWHGWNYAEYVEALRKQGSKLLVEQKLPLWYMRERNAIVDAVVLNDDGLHVIDFKYGEGVVVSPENNLQAAIYAVCVVTSMGQSLPTEFPVHIHIYQPRGRAAEDGASHVWETTWLEVCQLTEKVSSIAAGIQDGSEMQMFLPSDKACQWCPAKGFCTARQASLADGFEVIDDQPRPLPPAGVLALDQVQRILHHKDAMVKWLNDVEQWAEDHLKGGGKIPGFKLVQSRGGNRYWSDPKRAAALLLKDTVLRREDIIEETMVSPAQVEEKLGKAKFKVFNDLVSRKEGAPVLAPESDKRPAVGSAIEDFEVLP